MTAVLELALGLVSLESVLGGDLLEPNAGDAYPPFPGWINGELHDVLTVLQRVVVYQVSGDDRACALFADVFVDPADIKPRQGRKTTSGWSSRESKLRGLAARNESIAKRRAAVVSHVCIKCGLDVPLEDFYLSHRMKRHWKCITCSRLAQIEYHKSKTPTVESK